MEGEGTSQAELFTGWSSVIHQPCEEPEERDLPSTVDIAAFTNLNVEPANSQTVNDESDTESDSSNSSEASSHSDSSESDSSTSSTSRSSSPQQPPQPPEFAVTSSQTGLKLTIATVKKQQLDDSSDDSDSKCSNDETKLKKKKVKVKNDAKTKKECATINNKSLRPKTRSCTAKKMDSSDESDAGDESVAMLASCSLQEIRQEDLAAILPDQQETDAFGAKRSPDADDCSDSDMELPHQAVDALLQRTTGSSSESEQELPNPPALYANSLLQQFEAQTQMLSTQLDKKHPNNNEEKRQNNVNNVEKSKRRRGRSKKPKPKLVEVHGNSPDSGIQNSPDHVSSPEPIQRNSIRKTKTIKSVTSDDRHFYGNSERTLYPPRRRTIGRPAKKNTEPVKQDGKDNKTKAHNVGQRSKSSFLFEICERVSKRLELSKTSAKKPKVVALKASKVMHSKRRRDIHKKRKFKILKPPSLIGRDPKIQAEIEKLIVEFARLCVISAPLKRVSKKRKTNEYERKKKNKNPEPNEQRLPLKKRHYHLTSTVEEETAQETESPKHNAHIDEAIEACITKFSENETKTTPATTPKKRHRLTAETFEASNVETSPEIPVKKPKVSIESVVTELKMKRNLNSKLETSPSTASTKYPACKKTKPTEQERLDAITSEKPTGIFMPTIEDDPETSVQTQETSPSVKTTEKKKIRKRRAPNRTGFPTVKKKKKKPSVETTTRNESKNNEDSNSKISERVPVDGEEYTSFVSRTENANVIPIPEDDAVSDCESLPQDERTEFELNEFKIRLETSSPTTSVDTKDSDRTTGLNEQDLDDLPIGKRFELGSRKTRKTKSRESAEPEENRKNKKKPRWKKRYLTAGLFSDYYKEDATNVETSKKKNTEISIKSSKLTYAPSEHPYGLLPPPLHCGKYKRFRKTSFQLPYDLWWQHEHSQLSGRDVVPSWNYRKVRTNVYNVKNSQGNAASRELQTCNCTPSDGCGDDCINRLVLSECPANIHKCKNQKIQRHEWAPGLEKFMTRNKGWGVRIKLPAKANEFILEYVGEVVTEQEFKERMATIYANDTHHYCLHLDAGMVIDGHRMGGDGRFVNHSCEPNCEMQKWSVNGQFRMALFALRDIEAGEELTYDYNFSLYDPAEGQECKCGSDMCRGVIGGKTQRIRQPTKSAGNNNNNNNNNGAISTSAGRAGRPRKVAAARKTNGENAQSAPYQDTTYQLKPISHQQKCFILEHHCFLLRNIEKVRKVKDRNVTNATPAPNDHSRSAFLNHLNALQKPRNMKTRTIAQVEDDPDLNRSVKFASVLKNIFNNVVNYKSEDGTILATPLLTLPSKRKTPELYASINDPIDFSTVEQKIEKGAYRTSESFDDDMNRVFRTIVKFYGQSSGQGIAATLLKKIYQESKRESSVKFEEMLGTKPPSVFSKKDKSEEEDIIRCICGMYHDEGLMIQCERCFVWQHCECIGADPAAPSYHCEQCVPRTVDYEIPTNEFTEHGHKYFMTLMRGDLQLRQGDTVYVLRDINIPGTNKKHTFKTIGKVDYNDLDIFRIERLWKDSKTGERMAYGHHYLRPHETYHEPKRKFFPNEVMRVPLYEAVSVELIVSRCWVLDLNTYCKGRPIDADEKHIYICEYRVDKLARVFHKVSNRAKYPVCTKSYVFERFPERLRVSRTYAPHELDEEIGSKIKPKRTHEERSNSSCITTVSQLQPKIRDLNEQKSRLNKILLNLLNKLPGKEQPVDISYLLEGGRRRKNKATNNNK